MHHQCFSQFFSIIAFVSLLSFGSKAQTNNTWTLQQSVQYALQHNLTIQQSELNKRLAEYALQQSKYSLAPNLNINTGYGKSYGRSVDPTTNQFVMGSYDFMSISGSADVLLFGWFQKRNAIQKNDLSLAAAKADLEQLQNDISLNVATGFLRALLAKEQIKISEKQVELSKVQLLQTNEFVKSGRLPELNLAQLESQLATDSANLINAIANFNSATLDLKALLNLPFATPFNIEAPNVDLNEQFNLNGLLPETIFETAASRFGLIKSSELKLEAAKKNLSIANANRYPSLILSAQFGTNYASTFREVTGITMGQPQATSAFVKVADSLYFPVYQPTYEYQTRRIPLSTQFDNNFRQTLNFGLNIPVFNGLQAHNAVKQAQINVLSNEINKEQASLRLKQDVYKAYNEGLSAIQKYQAANRATDAARRAYNFAQKRYELGLTNTVEYLTVQNNQFIAESNLLSAKYDLIFKLKVIDYYLGKELKL